MMKKKQFNQKIIVLLFVAFFTNILQAQIKVTGTILDDNDKSSMIGVSVVEIGTKNGTITNIDGKYSINVKSAESKLEFSFIGKERRVIPVGKKTDISLSLVDAALGLDEVVVIGYGSVKKSDLTGSVSSMKAKDLEESKSGSFTSALSGKISGVSAVQNGGAPGSGIDIKIRGASSVSASTSPLYIIDGLMMENSELEVNAASRKGGSTIDPMAMINPDDIESIEVLKDASATAIYGSRGANGVVLITTKSGTKDNVTRIHFSTDQGFDFLPQKRISVLNGSDYEDYMRLRDPLPIGFEPDVTVLTTTQAQYWDIHGLPISSGVTRNWQDEVFQTGKTKNYNFSLRGGTKQTQYTFSTGYLNKEGIVKTSSMDRLTFNTKIDNTFNKYIKVGLNMNASYFNQTGVISEDPQTGNSLFTQMLIFRPNIADSTKVDSNLTIDDPANPFNNPVNSLKNIIQKTQSRRIQGKAYVNITPFKGLMINSSFGGYSTDVKSKNFYPSTTGPGRLANGQAMVGSSNITNWLNENTATYNLKIDRDNKLTLMGGVTFQRTIFDRQQTTGTELDIQSLGVESIQFAQLLTETNSYTVNSLMSYLGRLNYSYKDKYLLTGSLRADGSSKFQKGNKFSYFPSAAFAWKMNEENFLKNVRQLDLLKLRLSYGMTGNQDIAALSGMSLMNKTYYSFNTQQGGTGSPVLVLAMYPGSQGNEDLKWETTSQVNGGIDIMLLKSRVNLSLDFYYKYTKDLLITEQLEGISGYQNRVNNVGSVENKGIEISLNTVNIKNKKFTWGTDFNFSINRNKVLEIGNGDRIPVTPTAIMQGHYLDVFYVREGYPIGAMFGYQTDGLYKCEDFKQFYNTDGSFISDQDQQKTIYDNIKATNSGFTLVDGVISRGNAMEPGFLKLKKQGDGTTITNDDRVYLGSAEPLFFGGFTNRFSYKNFELSMFLQFSYGNKLFNTNYGMIRGYSTYNIEKDYYDNMWLVNQQNGTYHNYSDGTGRQYATDLQAEDASYLKLKDISLSYNVPKLFVSKLKIKALRFYISAKNAFTLTKYSWYDPEYSSRNPLSSGIDKASYPNGRTVMGGVSINL
ncbi:MAG: TonB-dependent receptor [Paludibacter sp.]|nr:TonB-dependent receptor [Paludibacter sp.]